MGRRVVTEYRRVTGSAVDFVHHQLTSCYLTHGYWLYVSEVVVPGKDPMAVHRKLVETYVIDVSRSTSAGCKAVGLGNLHYLRSQRWFFRRLPCH